MKQALFALALATSLLGAATGCEDKGGESADAHDEFSNLSVDEVSTMIDGKKVTPVDANGAETRTEKGVLPGAVLLSDYSEYDISELPDDKKAKLVFYCGSESCSAAPKAAKLAKDAGYEDVNVMRAGIKGWVDAGKSVDKPAT